MNTREFYSELAGAVEWLKVVNDEYRSQAEDKMERLASYLPYGSGFDNGSHVNLEKSTGEKIVIDVDFHHMDENGYYNGWSEHEVIVTPSLRYGFKIRVTGRDRNNIKEYISLTFHNIRS